jgi:hypothetical protein
MGLFGRHKCNPDSCRDPHYNGYNGTSHGFDFYTDKPVSYHDRIDGQNFYFMADGSWANADTGEVFDATGDGFLYAELSRY